MIECLSVQWRERSAAAMGSPRHFWPQPTLYRKAHVVDAHSLLIDRVVGKSFGNWTVLSFAGYYKGKIGTPLWHCVCLCGREKDVQHHALMDAKIEGCWYCGPRRRGHRGRSPTPIEQRFWEKVIKSEYGCWSWSSSKNPAGYGILHVHGKPNVLAHRFSYELHCGNIPEGLCVLHACDNPPCTRPDHLFLGTRLDNNRDMAAKMRSTYGERNPGAILTDEYVRDILSLNGLGIDRYFVGRIYGVSGQTVYEIWRGLRWKHIARPVGGFVSSLPSEQSI